MMLRCILIIFLASTALAETCKRPVISAPVVPPFVHIDTNGEFAGPSIEKGLRILKPLFPDLIVAPPTPHARILNDLKIGKIDIQVFELLNEERQKVATYSNPVDSINWVVMTRSDLRFTFNGLESLDPLRGAYIIKSPMPVFYKDYMENNPTAEAISHPSAILNLFELDRIDYMLTLDETIQFHIEKHPTFNKEDFTLHKESRIPATIHLAISNRSPCLYMLEAINQRIDLSNNASSQ